MDRCVFACMSTFYELSYVCVCLPTLGLPQIKTVSHTEAASIPYVATTALTALVNAGYMCRGNCANKRVLITGASGGVGKFSIQVRTLTMTCSHNAKGLVRGLGADEVADYTAGDVAAELALLEKWVLFVGIMSKCWALGLLMPWAGAKYVTLVTPFLLNTDSMGLLEGTVHSGFILHQKAITNMCNGVFYRWGFNVPDGLALDKVSQLVDARKVLHTVCSTMSTTLHALSCSTISTIMERGVVIGGYSEDG
uniref:Enoyl reductase (ER) domain-containing protein n=1 Tax=Hucho hucho TaxID=62062 RepID=A0A4W5L5Z7_9TELE